MQSHVPQHSEGAWLLGSVATFGELQRMTQFKDKSEGRESVSVDLFTYPVLQAADILLYLTDRVPVGDDQRQHLELARNIAQRFNSRYGETLRLPEAAIPSTGGRVMDLQEPTRKMSTTGGTPQGTVLVIDPPDVVAKKVRSAVTDSGREVRRGEGKEGIANLIEILGIASGRTRRAGRGGLRRRRLRPVQDATSPRPSSSTCGRCASATWSCGPTRPTCARCSPPARSGPRPSPPRRSASSRSGWASSPRWLDESG